MIFVISPKETHFQVLYIFIPAKVEIAEHHVGVYASKKDGRILKADHPKNFVTRKFGISYDCSCNHE